MRFSFFALLLVGASVCSAHDHLALGVADLNNNGQPDPGEPLQILDAGLVIRPEYHLLPVNTGQRYGGYYALGESPRTLFPNDYFTLIALSDGQAEIAEPGHAATGAYLWARISSVKGPDGARLGFWDQNRAFFFTTPTVSFLTNQPPAAYNYEFVLSEPLSLPVGPDEDPYGHIHNRGFTVDKPGVYEIGFTFYDRSTNGPGGGPIHPPSAEYKLRFVASIPDLGMSRNAANGAVTLSWASQSGVNYRIDVSPDLANWAPLTGTLLAGTGATLTTTDAPPNGTAKRYYRLVVP
ncbi:MAG: hypothetical protein JSR82_21635 [Verrucomicrobia bacterium]|nr:hypothetical protein [Verrucomicrobiota bacterium]